MSLHRHVYFLIGSPVLNALRTLEGFTSYKFTRLSPEELSSFLVLNTLLRDEVEVRSVGACSQPVECDPGERAFPAEWRLGPGHFGIWAFCLAGCYPA